MPGLLPILFMRCMCGFRCCQGRARCVYCPTRICNTQQYLPATTVTGDDSFYLATATVSLIQSCSHSGFYCIKFHFKTFHEKIHSAFYCTYLYCCCLFAKYVKRCC